MIARQKSKIKKQKARGKSHGKKKPEPVTLTAEQLRVHRQQELQAANDRLSAEETALFEREEAVRLASRARFTESRKSAPANRVQDCVKGDVIATLIALHAVSSVYIRKDYRSSTRKRRRQAAGQSQERAQDQQVAGKLNGSMDIGHKKHRASTTKVPSVSMWSVLGGANDNQKLQQAWRQLSARDRHWQLVREASNSKDHKEYSKDPEWRSNIVQAHSRLLEVCDSHQRKLEQVTNLVRSEHPGRAQLDVNPTQVAIALQPAVDNGSVTQEQASTMVQIVTKGISVEEFRELDGEAMDLSAGNAEDPEDHRMLLDFYFAQAAMGRVLLFPPEDAQTLDSQGSVVLSPSFLVKALGKNPRPICNLSSCGNNGVNQMMGDFDANPEGYTTIPGVAEMIVKSYVQMVLRPEEHGIKDIKEIDFAMLVADAADAFTRVSVSAEAVGMQCMRIAGITVVPLCCLFGWRRSAEVFSHVTASITAAYKSDLNQATFTSREFVEQQLTAGMPPAVEAFIKDKSPSHEHLIESHVDDFCVVVDASRGGHIGAAADLIWAIKSHLGAASISVKKFHQSTFWSGFQKVIGAWFNVNTFTVTMPHNKIVEVIDILESPEFDDTATEFEIDLCATLRGKLRWALYATKLGDSPALINIEKQRTPDKSSKRKVKPLRHHHESQKLATLKFMNDMKIYRLLMYACRDNPAVASCSLLSVLPIQQRLGIPGQSKWLVWLSGDFSFKGQSFGIEVWHPTYGHQKMYSVLQHPQATIEALRKSLAGKSKKGLGIVSSVTERLNKLMAEFMWRDMLRGRPCICLEDNQGSVATINSGYSAHVALQAMQLASNLRQAIDEAPMTSYYCNTENMSWMDRTSRMDQKFAEKMNADLAELGLPTWQFVEPCNRTAKALNEWLPKALNSEMPLLDDLLQGLDDVRTLPHMPAVSLLPEDILQDSEPPWQDRVRAAAKPIPHYMGSFGPAAYSTDHLEPSSPQGADKSQLSWSELRARNEKLAVSKCYTMFDNFHGGCGGSVAAIQAGLFVQAGADNANEEANQFESLTGRVSLGDVDFLDIRRIPAVHVWFSCSSCIDFSDLGHQEGINGSKGGSHFTSQFEGARAAGAKVVVIENVNGVATLHGGIALQTLQEKAEAAGYSKFYHTSVTFALWGDPENRSRRVIVAFHDSVKLASDWVWPSPCDSKWSLEHNERKCAGEVLRPSSEVPSRFWDDRPTAYETKRWSRGDDLQVHHLGYKNRKSKIGNPRFPSRVWSPAGLFPTCLASGNSGLVRTICLRAMCPLYTMFDQWVEATLIAQASKTSKQVGQDWPRSLERSRQLRGNRKGGIRERRPMPIELLESKGFPPTTPIQNDKTGFRFAGNAVPIPWFTLLFDQVIAQLEGAEVSKDIPRNEDQYCTWLSSPMHPHDLEEKSNWLGQPKQGHNTVHNRNRASLTALPVSTEELQLMSAQNDFFREGRYEEESLGQINMAWEHWRSFCLRFNRSLYLRVDTKTEVRAAFQQAKLFLLYETALFRVKAASVAQKLWAIGAKHKAAYLDDPFSNNQLLRDAIANAVAKDAPKKPKIPVSNATLDVVQQRLDLKERKSFVLWTAIRFAISWLCRISEYAYDGKHSIQWKQLIFYTSKRSAEGRKPLTVRCIADVYRAAELQVIFYSDKTNPRGAHAGGQGKARSFHAIPDIQDSRCIVRDMARLWLASERCSSYKVFSWDADTAGVTRQLISDVLKEAAVASGIPAADIATHSLRRTGLSRLLAPSKHNPIPLSWPAAREFGRWESDCAYDYFWPSTELAEGYSKAIWESPIFIQVRGDGAVKTHD